MLTVLTLLGCGASAPPASSPPPATTTTAQLSEASLRTFVTGELKEPHLDNFAIRDGRAAVIGGWLYLIETSGDAPEGLQLAHRLFAGPGPVGDNVTAQAWLDGTFTAPPPPTPPE